MAISTARMGTALERLYRVLDWTDGRFELTSAEVTAPDSIGKAISFVLLEHARRTDERGRESLRRTGDHTPFRTRITM